MDRKIQDVASYFAKLGTLLKAADSAKLELITASLYDAFHEERNVFIFGNGGSASLASHFACDLGKGITYDVSERRMRVMSLTDNIALMTAWSNDDGYDRVFVEQLRNFCQPDDVLLAISGSGNSPNVLRALEFGRELGTINLGLTGFSGGKMLPLCDHCFVVDSSNMQMIEDIHTMSMHAMVTMLHKRIAGARSPVIALHAGGRPR
jgi:D-sedoheptulose 7-phosphate isomerase